MNDGKAPTHKAWGRAVQGRGVSLGLGRVSVGAAGTQQPLPATGRRALPLEMEVRGRDAESRSGVWILCQVFWEATGDF